MDFYCVSCPTRGSSLGTGVGVLMNTNHFLTPKCNSVYGAYYLLYSLSRSEGVDIVAVGVLSSLARRSGLRQNVCCGKSLAKRIAYWLNLHDITNRLVETSEFRVLLLEWRVTLHSYIWQYAYVLGNCCTRYSLTQGS